MVVVGDHGYFSGDHGEPATPSSSWSHHACLIVRTPWGPAAAAGPVPTVDILPTVLDVVGLAPQEGIDGRSLARALFDPAAPLDHTAYSETYFPRYHFGWQHLRSLRDDRYTYVDAPHPELYDRSQDPGETRNVFKAYSQRAETLRVRLEEMSKTTDTQAPERKQLDP